MKIDIFNHIVPQIYLDKLVQASPALERLGKRIRSIPAMVDLDTRFKIMDKFDDYAQVICLGGASPDEWGSPELAQELTKIANDGMAEYVFKYPDRFPGFVASLTLHNPDVALEEMDRAVKDLGAKGFLLFTNINGLPLDQPDFVAIFEKISSLDVPIWLHPARRSNFPDYLTEDKSKYELWWVFGWPYETSIAMGRIVLSGYFDRYPNLKIITHHMGAMVPYFEGRVGPGLDQLGSRTADEDYTVILKRLKRKPIDYFKKFYADTALFGSLSATKCGLDFFGLDHVLFATDCPFDPEKGPGYIRDTIKVIEALSISEAERRKIYEGNARNLLRL